MGAHERTSIRRRFPPPPPELDQARRPVTVIPQRERITYLVRLSEAFAPMAGLLTAFAVIENYPVLNVIPADGLGRAVTVGCHYGSDGAWWLYNVHTGDPIRSANDLSGAACQIRGQVEGAAAA